MSYFKLYLYIFTIISCFVQVINIPILYFGVFILLVLLYSNKKIETYTYLIFSMLLPNKLIQFLGLFIYILLNIKKLKRFGNRYVLYFTYFIIISSLINILFFEGNILNFIIQLCIYLIYLLSIYFLRIEKVNIEYFLYNVKSIFYSQIIVATLQLIMYRQMGDVIKGTFLSAHYYGVFLLLFLYKYISVNTNKFINIFKKKREITLVALIIFQLFIADAKHVYLVFIIALVIYIFINKLNIKNMVVVSGMLLLIIVIAGVQVFKLPSIKNFMLINYSDEAQYVYRNGYNQKYLYFDRTIHTLIPFRGIIGLGVGQYGSQAANFMAYDTIYKIGGIGNRKDIFRSYITDTYEKNIGDLMTEDYVTNIENISMVMSFPIVSFISLIGELGLIGYCLFLFVLQNLVRKKEDSVFIIFFLLLSIFDIYFEIPSVFIMIILFAFYTNPINLKLKGDKHEKKYYHSP